MTKVTLAVCKVYKNTGRFRSHRKNTKPAWKHYFLSDDYTEELKFGTEWVDSVTAQLLKLKKWHKRNFLCLNCHAYYSDYIKNDRRETQCPYCEDE